jgi:hypothetical protein
MHSDWFNRIEILQVRWQHGEKVEHCYPSRLEKTLYKWDEHVLLVTKGLSKVQGHFKSLITTATKGSVLKIIVSTKNMSHTQSPRTTYNQQY